jgi:outer membrane protein
MKYLLQIGVFVFVLGLGTTHAQKFGHINTQELLAAMPETDSAQAKIEAEAKQLEEQLEMLQVEYNNKLEQYNKDRETLSPVIIQTKEQELIDYQQRIQQFRVNAEQGLQRRNQELFQPLLDKANKAIEAVAQEKGFTYVLDSSTGVLVYISDNSEDLLPLVKQNLGIE